MPHERSKPIRASLRAELERCRRAYESSGNFAAVIQAIHAAGEADSCPPWLAKTVLSVYAARFEYWRIASVSVTIANATSVVNGRAMSEIPAPLTSTAREIVTK